MNVCIVGFSTCQNLLVPVCLLLLQLAILVLEKLYLYCGVSLMHLWSECEHVYFFGCHFGCQILLNRNVCTTSPFLRVQILLLDCSQICIAFVLSTNAVL